MPDRTLGGRVALVTGVSRRTGIGRAVADRLALLGAEVQRLATHSIRGTPAWRKLSQRRAAEDFARALGFAR